MKALTFNLRVDTGYDGTMRFQFRKGLILDKLETELPDWVGVQECTPSMARFLREHLPMYAFMGVGRDKDLGGENNMLGYLRDKWDLLAYDTFWLSPEPHTPGSRYPEQSDCPRVCVHELLVSKETGKMYHVYNTHLDHVSDEARRLGAGAILDRMARDLSDWDAPALVMGDMNAAPDSLPIQAFKAAGLKDETDGIGNTWHDYLKRPDEPQIDFILTRGFPPSRVEVWRDQLHGVPLSDHYPVCAVFEG